MSGVGSGPRPFFVRAAICEQRYPEEVTAMSTQERVRDVVAPLVAERGLDLYDLELGGGVLKVTVAGGGGVDLDQIAAVTREVSHALDDADPIQGRYTLEVTTPGLERKLRTPDHFARAIGETVRVKTHPEVEGERRLEGVLAAADGSGVVLRLEGSGERRLAYEEIDRARTVFVWGPSAKEKEQ